MAFFKENWMQSAFVSDYACPFTLRDSVYEMQRKC